MKNLQKFNEYCKFNQLKCIAHPIGDEMCLVTTPTFSRKFTFEALAFIDKVLVAVNDL